MNKQTPLSLDEFNRLLNGRAKVGPKGNDIFVSERLIDFELNFTDILYNGSRMDVTVSDLIFRSCLFQKKVTIGDHQCAGNIEFVDCAFEDHVRIESTDNISWKGYMALQSASFRLGQKKEIARLNVKGVMVVESIGGVIIKNINTDLKDQTGMIDIHGSNEIIILEDVNVQSCDIRQNSVREVNLNRAYMQTFSFGAFNGSPQVLRIIQSQLDQLIAYKLQQPGSVLDIRDQSVIGILKYRLGSFYQFDCVNSTIDVLEFFGKNDKDHSVNIASIEVRDVVFRDMQNNGIISLKDLKQPTGGYLKMLTASLGRTDFILCNFQRGIFEFENSKITETFMAESDFPRRVMTKGKENFSQAQLAFGQIATAFQKQGDTVRYLEYQAREIEAHYRELDWFRAGLGSFSFTKLSLLLNKISNDFSRNWVRGILFSFLVGGFFYYWLVISSDEYHIALGFRWDGRLIGSFLKFMNPLRFFETENLFKDYKGNVYLSLSPVSYLIDFFSRVFVAYGFYQTVQAFRRYGRTR